MLHTECRWFDSIRTHHYTPVAKWLRPAAHNGSIGGSNPSRSTIYARLAQLAEALVLGTKGSPFESEVGHQFKSFLVHRDCPVG